MLAAHWEGNPNIIYCKAKGNSGANEMASHLEDSEVMYALGRKDLAGHMILLNSECKFQRIIADPRIEGSFPLIAMEL